MKFKNVIAAGCSWVNTAYHSDDGWNEVELTREHSFYVAQRTKQTRPQYHK